MPLAEVFLSLVLGIIAMPPAGVFGPAEEALPLKTPTELSQADLSFVEANGIRMRIASQGQGPLVVLIHGFPELWLSWRHQLSALAQAGYRAVAPDMRGYGQSDAPPKAEDYDVLKICGDVVGLMDALGERQAVLVGHDWGSWMAWQCALFRPERFRGLAAMSVPYGGRGTTPPLAAMRSARGDNFFYMLYFQEPGVAEAELNADPRGLFERFFASPGAPREAPSITSPKADAGGLLGRIGRPQESPSWLTSEEFEYYVKEFSRTGFRGGLNYYRNFNRNWELTESLDGKKVAVPTVFIAGDQDIVLTGRDLKQVESRMNQVVEDLRGFFIIEGAGHWIQQERAEEVNRILLEFLGSLGPGR